MDENLSGKRVGVNYILYLSYQITSLLIPLITAPYLSRVLGAESIGLYSYASSIVSYFVLFAALGTAVYGQREISYCQTDRERRSICFWSIECISCVTSMLCLVAYLFFIRTVMGSSDILFLILSLNIVNVMLDIVWLYQGMENFTAIVIRDALIRMIHVLCIFLFVKTKNDLNRYVLITSLALFFSCTILWIGLRKYVSGIKLMQLEIRRHIPDLILLFIPSIATTFYNYMDKTMLGAITGNMLNNGYYEQAMKVSQITMTLITSLSTVMLPRIGALFHEGAADQIRDSVFFSFRYVSFLSCPIALGLFGVASNFVPWFFGDEYGEVISILRILCLRNVVIAYSNVAGLQILIPTRQQNKLTVSVFSGAAVNYILNMLLIPTWYAAGAAVASVVSEMVVSGIQLYFVRHIIEPGKLIRSVWKYYLAAAVMLLGILGESTRLSPSITHTCVMIVTGAMIYFAVLIVVRDSLFLEAVRSINRRMRRKT